MGIMMGRIIPRIMPTKMWVRMTHGKTLRPCPSVSFKDSLACLPLGGLSWPRRRVPVGLCGRGSSLCTWLPSPAPLPSGALPCSFSLALRGALSSAASRGTGGPKLCAASPCCNARLLGSSRRAHLVRPLLSGSPPCAACCPTSGNYGLTFSFQWFRLVAVPGRRVSLSL